jgi:hypothetical protein
VAEVSAAAAALPPVKSRAAKDRLHERVLEQVTVEAGTHHQLQREIRHEARFSFAR